MCGFYKKKKSTLLALKMSCVLCRVTTRHITLDFNHGYNERRKFYSAVNFIYDLWQRPSIASEVGPSWFLFVKFGENPINGSKDIKLENKMTSQGKSEKHYLFTKIFCRR